MMYEIFFKKNNDDEQANTDYAKCKTCKQHRGQTCCESMPCELSPSDLVRIDRESITALLDAGLAIIDWWEGDIDGLDEYPCVYYLRMRAVGETGYYNPAWGGVCAALKDGEGCQIPFGYRPKYGRTGMACEYQGNDSSKKQAVREWRPYHGLLEDIVCSS